MKSINHTRNAAWFGIVLFWIAVVGIFYTAYQHSTNAFALSWITWLVYASVAIVVIYAGLILTLKVWNIK